MAKFTAKLRGNIDTRPIRRSVDRKSRMVGSRFGGLVRTIARRSMPRSGQSRAGRAPVRHTNTLYNSIFFAYDPVAKSVIIGPRAFRRYRGITGARALELGGTIRDSGTGETYQIRPRPYMYPALIAGIKSLPKLWREANARIR